MKSLLKLIAVATLTLLSVASHAQSSSVSHKSVVVRHTSEDQNCATNCYLKEAYLGSPHAVGDILKLGIGARQIHDTPIDGIPAFPRKTTWTGTTEAELTKEYNTFFKLNIDAYTAGMVAWQASRGLATATHDVIQKIFHRGKEKRLIVNIITFDNGNMYYNGAKMMPDDANATSTVLYIRAIPSAPGPFLPAEWNWPNPGTLQYGMRSNFDFISDTGLTALAVGNVYDEPFAYGVTVNPDARVNCLFNRANTGCGQTQPDTVTLIGNADATYAIVDYYRLVKPTGQPFGSGMAAVLNSRVTDRTVNFACATANDGTYGQVFRWSQKVDYVIDRYTVYPDGKSYFTQRFKEERFGVEVARPSTLPITRNGEYPNLNTRFGHHRLPIYTDQGTTYPLNTIPLGAVNTVTGASCGGGSCSPQPDNTQTLQCAILNPTWTGTFTRTNTFNLGLCGFTSTDNTTTCNTGGGGGGTDLCDNIPGIQTVVPPGLIQQGTSCGCPNATDFYNTARGVCEPKIVQILCQDNTPALDNQIGLCPACPDGQPVTLYGECRSYLRVCGNVNGSDADEINGVVTWTTNFSASTCRSDTAYSLQLVLKNKNGIDYWKSVNSPLRNGQPSELFRGGGSAPETRRATTCEYGLAFLCQPQRID